jgi:hypothetical protein
MGNIGLRNLDCEMRSRFLEFGVAADANRHAYGIDAASEVTVRSGKADAMRRM